MDYGNVVLSPLFSIFLEGKLKSRLVWPEQNRVEY